eukprot:gnl/TRDRNA2_/TRDRNA2_153384_c0_seq2.p1 gnl/TRDRNA2_/TRDRNA2_153384_c0~~gnl/TRDRNA2_/TRDRNA2_153384_c0_seq2.p1  ORF type:complete len:503 (+),score=56.63 gnl/TRDRNA2_/TRDRNA2_153384_c0_seq2:71-1510(+)
MAVSNNNEVPSFGVAAPRCTDEEDIENVIEKIGFGRAQWYLMLLSTGIWFCDGAELALVSVLRKSVAHDLNLDHNQQAFLSTAAYSGILVGTVLSGKFGDTWGRRPPVLASYFLVTVFGLLSAAADNCALLLTTRAFLGLGIGLGIPPTIAMVSESTPKEKRMLMRGIQGFFAGIGALSILVVVCCDDSTLEHVKWKVIVVIATLPALILGICSFLWMPETAAFLISTGRKQEGLEVLRWMKKMNGAEVSCDNVVPRLEADSLSFWQQVQIVLEPRYFNPLVIAAAASWVLHMHSSGCAYAASEVIDDDKHGMKKGMKLLTLHIVAIPFIYPTVRCANLLSRQKSMVLAACVGALASGTFAATGRIHHKDGLVGAIYFLSGFLTIFEQCLGYTVLGQFAVEVPPTIASATGGALVTGAGKVGSLCAPLVFECLRSLTGEWNIYFYITACGFVLCTWLLSGMRMPNETKDALETTPLKLP